MIKIYCKVNVKAICLIVAILKTIVFENNVRFVNQGKNNFHILLY